MCLHPTAADIQQRHEKGKQGWPATPTQELMAWTGEAGPAPALGSELKSWICCLENFFLTVEGFNQVLLSLQSPAEHPPPKPTCAHVSTGT